MSWFSRFPRRPSPATALAAVALFVALGGPAWAGQLVNGKRIKPNTVTTKQIKDHSIGERDVDRALLARLLAVVDGSVTGSSVADRSLGASDLAPGSIDGDRIAPGAVGSSAVTDGGLSARDLAAGTIETDAIGDGSLRGADVGRFSGTIELPFGAIQNGKCASSTSASISGPTPTENLSDDAIAVTPRAGFPASTVITAEPAGANQIEVTICNLSGAELTAGNRKFNYLTIDIEGN
jgi:hypothetical protein